MKILMAGAASIALLGTAGAFELSPLFNIEIRLSPKAAAKLASSGEAISIGTEYFGDAKLAVDTEKGRISLAHEDAQLAGAGTVAMGGIELPEAELAKIEGPARMDVNVYSARKVFADNLLSCGFWSDGISAIPDPIVIDCALIEE